MKKVLITGAAGFIGSALAKCLLRRGDAVVAVDHLAAVDGIPEHSNYIYYKADVREESRMTDILRRHKPDKVVHLAGITGMKDSFSRPGEFYSLNVNGTQSMLEACRLAGIKDFIYASSVAVYGNATEPVTEDYPLPPPLNPYAATKGLSELLSMTYSRLYNLNITILRVFSVYGPGQRHETAVYKFTSLIDAGRPVQVYGDGSALRDYLYLDDCTGGIMRAIDRPFRFEVINLGEQRTITLLELIRLISCYLGKPAQIEYVPAPEGIPGATWANIEKARRLLGFEPGISMEEGLQRFVQWYKSEKV